MKLQESHRERLVDSLKAAELTDQSAPKKDYRPKLPEAAISVLASGRFLSRSFQSQLVPRVIGGMS